MADGFDFEKLKQKLTEYGINTEGSAVAAAIGLIVGLVKRGRFSHENMQNFINNIVKFYDNHPAIMSSLGLGIGTLCLLNSINDVKDVNRLKQELLDAFTKYPPDCWKQRLTEIRRSVDRLKSRQLIASAMKFVAFISFGYISWAGSVAMWARGALAIGAGLSATASVIHGVNYYNLDALINRLEKDGHLA